MVPRRRTATVVLWQIRTVFRVLCWLATSVDGTMVALAHAFKRCRRASTGYGPLVIPVQVLLVLAWVPIRLLFLGLAWAATGAYRIDTRLRRRWALAG